MLLQYAEALCAKRLVLASASPRRREILGNLVRFPFSLFHAHFQILPAAQLTRARFAFTGIEVRRRRLQVQRGPRQNAVPLRGGLREDDGYVQGSRGGEPN